MSFVARSVDALLEASVVGSFSRLGIVTRRSLEAWSDPPPQHGKIFIVTGASSGIGRASAVALARLGASVTLLGRDPKRTETAWREAASAGTGGEIEQSLLDVGDSDAVERFTREFSESHGGLDGLIHNAGALFRDYGTVAGVERTVATHVLAPFRLSWLLAPMLRQNGQSVIVTVSSGGMYTEPFDLDRLEMPADAYRGVTAYARAKRAQVVLSREWARRWGSERVASYATHPGLVDTPGLSSGLPDFRHLGPLLRTASEGADTVVWLAAGGALTESHSGFWHDRHQRREYRLPWTAPTPGAFDAAGADLWSWCAARTGLGCDTLESK
jgi:NAD(P)-dependent dehydrogenase (short-subunit alcohol dehydrogenase family)